jgi:hypothetical protein
MPGTIQTGIVQSPLANLALVMATEVWQQNRPKGRKPCWAFRVTDGEKVIFQSRQVSMRLLSHDAAFWVARLVETLHGPGQPLEWRGEMEDDCSAIWKDFDAHAEHLHGPRRGGSWYCSVSGPDMTRFFHTADQTDVRPRSGCAARWLCELVISAADLGLIEPYPA